MNFTYMHEFIYIYIYMIYLKCEINQVLTYIHIQTHSHLEDHCWQSIATESRVALSVLMLVKAGARDWVTSVRDSSTSVRWGQTQVWAQAEVG